MNQRDIYESLNQAALSVLTDDVAQADYSDTTEALLNVLADREMLDEGVITALAKAGVKGLAKGIGKMAMWGAGAVEKEAAGGIAKQFGKEGLKDTASYVFSKQGLKSMAKSAAIGAAINYGVEKSGLLGDEGSSSVAAPTQRTAPRQTTMISKGPVKFAYNGPAPTASRSWTNESVTYDEFTHVVCVLIEENVISRNQALKLLTLDEAAAGSSTAALDKITLRAIDQAAEKAAQRATKTTLANKLKYAGYGTGAGIYGNEYTWNKRQYGGITPWEHSSGYHVGYYPGVQPGAFVAGVAAGSVAKALSNGPKKQ